MIIVEPITKTAYLTEFMYKCLQNHDYVDQALKNKPKLSGTEQRYVAKHGVRICFDLSDETNLDQLTKLYTKLFGKKPTGTYLTAWEVICSCIGEKNKYCVCHTDDAVHVNIKETSDSHWKDYFECVVYTKDSFELVAETKGEIAKKKEIERKKNKAIFNYMVAKDVLLTALNNYDYNISIASNRYLYYGKVKGYNKLIKDALEYYLNNKVLKGTGCKINVSKVSNQHKYGYYDSLCDLGEAELKLK